jgi:hypothetical protein
LPTHIHFKYRDKELEIAKDFLYLGIKFSRLWSFRDGPFNFQEGGEGYVVFFFFLNILIPDVAEKNILILGGEKKI